MSATNKTTRLNKQANLIARLHDSVCVWLLEKGVGSHFALWSVPGKLAVSSAHPGAFDAAFSCNERLEFLESVTRVQSAQWEVKRGSGSEFQAVWRLNGPCNVRFGVGNIHAVAIRKGESYEGNCHFSAADVQRIDPDGNWKLARIVSILNAFDGSVSVKANLRNHFQFGSVFGMRQPCVETTQQRAEGRYPERAPIF